MANAKLVQRLSYETPFTRLEIEAVLAAIVVKSGVSTDFDSYNPHFKWDGNSCTVSFVGQKELPPPRAEHSAAET